MKAREWVAATSGAAALAVSVFAMGGVPRWAQAFVALLVAVAIFGQLGSRMVPAQIPPLMVVLAVATGLTILQLVPLGHSAVGALNPIGETLRADGARIAGVSPSETLTFDLPGSLAALAFFLILLGVAAVALRIATSERGRFGLLAAVAATCGVAALVVGVHTLVGARLLYGLYEPLHARPRVLGPLLNDNQLGCLMALGSVVAGGLVMYPRQKAWFRVVWIAIATGCAIVTLTTLSRGAAIALGAGAVVLVSTLVGQRITGDTSRSRTRLTSGSLQIGIVAICAVIVMVYASSGGVTKQLAGTSFNEVENPRSKFAAWGTAVELIEESPWAGWGRGAFEAAFTRVHPTSGLATFSYLENEYLQAVVDWGIPGALLLAIAGIWLAVRSLARWRSGPLAASGLAGLTVVALQSNVDFGVEFLGLAVPVTIVAATLTYVPMRQPGRRALRLARVQRLGHAIAILAGAAVLLSAATTTLGEDHDQTTDTQTLTVESLRDSSDRHPLDYRVYLLQAVVLTRYHELPRAIEALNHALQLHPTHPGLHLFLGELLRQSGYLEQAAVEYGLALRSSTDPGRIVAELEARMPNAELIATSIPADASRFDELSHVLEQSGREDVELAWLKRVLATGIDPQRTCSVLYELATRTKQVDVITVASEGCTHFSPPAQVKRVLARNALDQHDPRAALRLLADVETWTGTTSDKFAAWLTRCDAYQALDQLDDAERCLHQLDATGYAPNREVIEKHLAALATARIAHDAKSKPPSGE